MSRYTERKHRMVREETARLRAQTDYLWLTPFRNAWRQIVWGGQTDAPSIWVRVPFPFDDDSRWWCERLHALWKGYGYALRPGGPAGWGQDIIRLDKEN